MGQETEDICPRVRSCFLTRTTCIFRVPRNGSFRNTFGTWRCPYGRAVFFRTLRTSTYSHRTTVSSDLLTWISPSYLMNPSFLNLFMK